jgi:hypothetical protein
MIYGKEAERLDHLHAAVLWCVTMKLLVPVQLWAKAELLDKRGFIRLQRYGTMWGGEGPSRTSITLKDPILTDHGAAVWRELKRLRPECVRAGIDWLEGKS